MCVFGGPLEVQSYSPDKGKKQSTLKFSSYKEDSEKIPQILFHEKIWEIKGLEGKYSRRLAGKRSDNMNISLTIWKSWKLFLRICFDFEECQYWMSNSNFSRLFSIRYLYLANFQPNFQMLILFKIILIKPNLKCQKYLLYILRSTFLIPPSLNGIALAIGSCKQALANTFLIAESKGKQIIHNPITWARFKVTHSFHICTLRDLSQHFSLR